MEWTAFLLVENFVYIVLGLQRINNICFVDFAMNRIFYHTYLDLRYFLAVFFDRGYRVFEVLLDPWSKLSCFPDEQQFILRIVEHEDSPHLSRDQMEIRKSINMA